MREAKPRAAPVGCGERTAEKVVVIGQGHVGLPLAMRAVDVGYRVVGLDVDAARIKRLTDGESYVEDVPSDQVGAALACGRYLPTADAQDCSGFNVAVITVPAPLREGLPDLSCIEDAAKVLAPFITARSCVVLESTTYPGTTEELLIPILENGSHLIAGQDFFVGYSPERVDPVDPRWGLTNTPKVVSGIDPASLAAVKTFYSRLVERTVAVESTRQAELGPGVEDHCLPVDPSYLAWQVKRRVGETLRFIDVANDVNDHMPAYVGRRITRARDLSPGRAGPPGGTAPSRVRHISVISPMRNEADHIEGLIADLAAQDFDGEVDVFIADGGSTDNSVARATEAAAKHRIALTVIDNPEKWVSAGLNKCIRRAQGDLLVRLDCHSRYPPDYLRRCALASEETGAEVVGGVIVARGQTPTERAVACAMDSPFGGIDWTRRGRESIRRETDVAVFGAFRPEAFELAGLFDETLLRNQDDEFTLRLRRLGGRVVLDPSFHVYYTPRSTFRGVFRQYFEYGRWKIPIMLKYRQVSSLRSLAPIAFLGSVSSLAVMATWSRSARWLLVAECASYTAGALTFGALAVTGRREQWHLMPRVAFVFPTFHLSYGLGMLAGFAAALRGGRPKVGVADGDGDTETLEGLVSVVAEGDGDTETIEGLVSLVAEGA